MLAIGFAAAACGDDDASEPDATPASDAAQICDANTCNGRGECSDTGGVINCACDPQFAGDRCEECAEGHTGDDCDACDSGQIPDPDDPDTCIDDPCDPHPCSPGATCEGSTGKAVCECPNGAELPDCVACADGLHFDADGNCVADLCDGTTTTRILMVGNGYTSANALPDMVRELAEAEGCSVFIDTAIVPSARFSDHASEATTLAKIAEGSWDYVVLQNQSQVPAWLPADVAAFSVPFAQSLAAAIDAASPSAKILYYATWGRRAGDAINCSYYPLVCTFAGHTQALSEGYDQYVAATGDLVAPVGLAWKAVVDDASPPFPSDDLWMPDGNAPTLRGSYLAATVLYTRLFRDSPAGNPYAGGLSAADAAYLQSIADPYALFCGNGVIEAGETCDDGGKSATCNADCTIHACGDGVVNITAGEVCDDAGESVDCDIDCRPAGCGNGTHNATAGEDCDDAGESMACDADCTFAECSDGTLNLTAGEECDDGNLLGGDYCSPLCLWEPGDAYEIDNDAGSASTIVPSPTLISDHTIVPDDDVDYVSFDAVAGSQYMLRTGGSGTGFCEGLWQTDTVLTLYDTDGVTALDQNDDGPGLGFCSRIIFTAAETSTYFTAISSFGSSYGTYDLVVVEVPTTPLGALPATLTDLVDNGYENRFSFDGTSGTSYTVRILDSDCKSGDGSDLELIISRPDDTVIASSYENQTETCASASFTAAADETLLISIAQKGTPLPGGTYTLEVTSP